MISLPVLLSEGFQSWHESKLFIERLTTVSNDALHVLAGTCIWLVIALVFCRPVTSWLPLLGTLAIVIVNELVDLWVEIWPELAMQSGEAGKDILTTVAVPTLLFSAFRIAPRLTARDGRIDRQ